MPPNPDTINETYIELDTPDTLERDLLLAMRSKMIALQRQQKIRLLRKKASLIRTDLITTLTRLQKHVRKAQSLLPKPPKHEQREQVKEESPIDEIERLIKHIDEKIQRLNTQKENLS